MPEESDCFRVVKATRRDLDEILDWLKREYADEGQGFWPNRHLIEKSQIQDQDLWVVRANGKAVAFQVGNYGAEIVSVRKEFRGRGLGRKLLEATLERAIADNVNVLMVECEPKSSLGFWQKMEFERYHDRFRPGSVTARRILDRRFHLSPEFPRCSVRITFYPEEAGYGDEGNSVDPISVHEAFGARHPRGTISLERRILELQDNEPRGKDLVVKIEVDGIQLCLEKAKYDQAEALGMIRDGQGGCFYIDEIRPNAGA